MFFILPLQKFLALLILFYNGARPKQNNILNFYVAEKEWLEVRLVQALAEKVKLEARLFQHEEREKLKDENNPVKAEPGHQGSIKVEGDVSSTPKMELSDVKQGIVSVY